MSGSAFERRRRSCRGCRRVERAGVLDEHRARRRRCTAEPSTSQRLGLHLGRRVAFGRADAGRLAAGAAEHVLHHLRVAELDQPEHEQQEHRQHERRLDDGRAVSCVASSVANAASDHG